MIQGYTVNLDWCTFTIEDDTLSGDKVDFAISEMLAEKRLSSLFMGTKVLSLEDTYGKWGYKRAKKLIAGGLMMWEGHHHRMGICFVLPGKAMMCLDSTDSIRDVLCKAMGQGAKCSRLDVAFDFYELYTMEDFMLDALMGMGNKRRKVVMHETLRNGSGVTYDIGGRTSDRFVRVYDKAAQMKVKNQSWVRFEIETKRRIADMYFRSFCESGYKPLIADVAKRYPMQHNNCWAMMDTIPLKLRQETQESNTAKWVKSVCGAIVKGMIELGMNNALQLFNNELALKGYDGTIRISNN